MAEFLGFDSVFSINDPRTLILLFLARFYMWILVLTESKLLKKQYQDAWERVHSTK